MSLIARFDMVNKIILLEKDFAFSFARNIKIENMHVIWKNKKISC